MTQPNSFQLTRARALLRDILTMRQRIATLSPMIDAAQAHHNAIAAARYRRTNFMQHPDQLAGIAQLKRTADPDTAAIIVGNYHRLLTDMHDKPRDIEGVRFEKIKVDLHALPLGARPYLIGPMFDLSIGGQYVRLDLDRSQPPALLCYVATAGALDRARIKSLLPAIIDWLGAPYELTNATVNTVTLTQRASMPDVMPFNPSLLRAGHVYFGTDIDTRKPVYIPLAALTHTLAAGQSGSGKSVFLNQILLSLLFNLDHLHGLTLVDLKGGVELNRYAIHDKIRVISAYDDLPDVVAGLVGLMERRLSDLRNSGRRSVTTGYHVLVIDEYAAIQFRTFEDADAKKRHKKLLADLNLLAAQARAPGLRLWAQLQKPTADAMDTSFRANLQSIVAFNLLNPNASTIFDGLEGLPARPTDLPKGRFIFRTDGAPDRVIQAAFVPDAFNPATVLPRPAK